MPSDENREASVEFLAYSMHGRDDVGGKAVDNKGHLPGIGDCQGIDGLCRVLKAIQPKFVRNLVEQSLSYALGRDVSYYDEPTIKEIVAALEQEEYRFSRLILEVTKSFPFQHRRGVVD